MIKSFIKQLLPEAAVNLYKLKRQKNEYTRWHNSDSTIAPPFLVKQELLDKYRKKHNAKIFVETGTYLGDTTFYQSKYYSKLFTIELSDMLYKKATNRFKDNENIKVLNGDSGKVLNNIISELTKPTLFWLDGHYSEGFTAKGDKECPVVEELNAILDANNYKSFVILIDDARYFNGTKSYPTLEEVEQILRTKGANATVKVENDVIIIEFL